MDPATADRRHTVADRTGTPRRDTPERYGPWSQPYDPFRRWQRDGTWARIFTRLQTEAAAKGLITWESNADSTVSAAVRHTRRHVPPFDGHDG